MLKVYKGIVEISNKEYHSEKEHLSSSNLKTLLEDPGKFYKEKILGERKEPSASTQSNYDEGTYAHSLLLEPHLISKEFKFFDGWRKVGKEWTEFYENNKDFIILSKPQKVKVERWAKAAQEHSSAMSLLQGGASEVTLFGDLMGVKTKVRADYLNSDAGYILDIKTTSFPSDVDNFKMTAVNNYKYHLSAALYLMMFEQYYNKPFDFYFLVLGKSDASCEIYKLSHETRLLGEELVRKAFNIYKKCLESNEWSNKTVEIQKKLDEDDEYEILEI